VFTEGVGHGGGTRLDGDLGWSTSSRWDMIHGGGDAEGTFGDEGGGTAGFPDIRIGNPMHGLEDGQAGFGGGQ
jgi:hypothetical protein